MSEQHCPHEGKCLLLQTDSDRDCQTCRLCRSGQAEEYAVHVSYIDSPSQICRFHEIAAPDLPPNVSRVSIYRLADKAFYSKKIISYKPGGPEARTQINEQMANYFS